MMKCSFVNTPYVETESVEVDADLVSTIVGRGGYTHPLFDVATHGDTTPLPGQGVLLLAGGLVEQCGILDDAVALLEMKSVRFRQMVRAGDRLRVRVTPGVHRATSSGKHVQEFAWRIVVDGVDGVDGGVETAAEADIVMMMHAPVAAL